MRHFAAALLIPALLATAAQAESYTCKRTKLSTTGFTKKTIAEEWYPKTFQLQIQGSQAETFWGPGSIARDGKRRLFTIPTDYPNVDMRLRLFDNGRASAWLETGAGFNPTSPSKYACKRVG